MTWPPGSPWRPLPVATPVVTGVTHASGEVRPGDLYAALPGARRHGAEFVAGAAAAGAVAVLTDPAGAERAGAGGLPVLVVPDPRAVLGPLASAVYGDPTAQLIVIGLTGTAGKTSTAYLVESGLRAAGHTTGLIGTVETRLGDLVVDSVRTTPEATDLHAMLAAARERGVTAVVMEVSSHALAMGRVGGVRFTVGGWSNFGSDHLDFHADAADYFAAKARLFDGRCAVEVLNQDDPALRSLFKPATVSFSAAGDPAATWRADGHRRRGVRPAVHRARPGRPDAARRGGAARPAQRVERPARHRRPGRRRDRPGDRGAGACAPAVGCPAGWSRWAWPAGCAGWSTTRTRPTLSWPRWPRCGNSASAG